MRSIIALLFACVLAACVSTGQPATGVRDAYVIAQDSERFHRQADGAWVEIAHSGLPRFYFTHERDDGPAAIVFDETRNVRLRLDPVALKITEATQQGWRPLYDVSRVERGRLAAQPASAVTHVWFVGGGAFVREGDHWAELSPDRGLPIFRWREESNTDGVLVLRDDTRGARARIKLREASVDLYFPDWGDWRPHWRIRAADSY